MIVAALRRMFSATPSRRSLDAAGGGRRWKDAPVMRDGAREVAVSAATVAIRAQHFVMNDPNGSRIASALESNIVGAGIKPRSQHPHEETRARLNSNFLAWTDEADADRGGDFYALQAALFRDMAVQGEALAIFQVDPMTGAPTIRRLHPEQLDRSKTIRLENGRVIVNGVEFDARGGIIAYHIRPGAPGDTLAGLPFHTERYPAGEVIHLFRRLFPGQVRGLSWFAPVLLTGRELSDLLDAMLVRSKVAALFVGSIHDPDGSVGGFEGTQSGPTLDTTVEPGAIRVEQNGSRLDWSDPPDAGDTTKHASFTLRRIAAGMNVPFELASGDYSGTNYSSARAALLEFRRFCEAIQHHVIVFGLCRPVWHRFVNWQALTAQVSTVAYATGRRSFEAVKWLPPRWAWVDPQKDATAAILEMNAGLRSRSEIVAERGYDIETIDREIAADQARAKQLGIVINGITPTMPEHEPDDA